MSKLDFIKTPKVRPFKVICWKEIRLFDRNDFVDLRYYIT